MNKIRAAITGINAWVPEYRLTNHELSKMVDTSDEWIMQRVGIKERRILKGEGLGSSDLGEKAVKGLLEKTNTSPDEIDLVICGKQATDGDTAQVGPGLAQRLGFRQLTYVCKVREINLEGKKIVVERLLDEGVQVVETTLPALMTVVKDINQPRLPNVIPGGVPANPMGAAALTLSGGEYAIHGTNAPGSIGGFVSYGCIRMHNSDILDLFDRVGYGTRVVVTR